MKCILVWILPIAGLLAGCGVQHVGDDQQATTAASPAPGSSAPFPPIAQRPGPPDLNQLSRAFAVIDGNESSGTGFLLHFKGNTLLFTNAHVVSGNRNLRARLLSGEQLPLDKFAVAKVYSNVVAQSFDVAVFSLRHDEPALEYLPTVDQSVAVGDQVAVLGNSEGSGVVTQLLGKVTGIGPDLIETDAKFVQGNSGSPIIHLKTGKVIGIATFSTFNEYETFGKDSKFNAVERRFGCRIDTIPGWEFPGLERFDEEDNVVSAIMKRTDYMAKMIKDIFNGGTVSLELHQQADNPLAKPVRDYLHDMTASRALSKEDASDLKERFIRGLLWQNRADITTLNPNSFTEYHRSILEEELRYRDEIRLALTQLQNIQDGTRKITLP